MEDGKMAALACWECVKEVSISYYKAGTLSVSVNPLQLFVFLIFYPPAAAALHTPSFCSFACCSASRLVSFRLKNK